MCRRSTIKLFYVTFILVSLQLCGPLKPSSAEPTVRPNAYYIILHWRYLEQVTKRYWNRPSSYLCWLCLLQFFTSRFFLLFFVAKCRFCSYCLHSMHARLFWSQNIYSVTTVLIVNYHCLWGSGFAWLKMSVGVGNELWHMFHWRKLCVPFKATSFLDWNNDGFDNFAQFLVSLIDFMIAVSYGYVSTLAVQLCSPEQPG